MRKKYVFDEKKMKFVPFEEFYAARPKGSSGPAVHQDTMDATLHPADGRMYESKSRFRRTTKDHGCIEIGNEQVPSSGPSYSGDVKADLLRAFEKHGR